MLKINYNADQTYKFGQYGVQYIDATGMPKAEICCISWYEHKDENGEDGEICWLEGVRVIDEAEIHQGYGTKMMEEFFELLMNKSRGNWGEKQIIELTVCVDNFNAIAFYKKLGFRITKANDWQLRMAKEIKYKRGV